MRTPLFVVLLAFAALAGCSDGAPSGELAPTGERPVADGTVAITYQEAVRPLDEATGGLVDQCTPDTVPPGTPLDMGRCQDPYSLFSVHFMSLPDPGATGYTVVLANATGEELSLGTLTAGEGGMFEAEFNQSVDLDGFYESVQVRAGTFVLAQAPALGGSQAFGLSDAATSTSATGTYSGKTLTLQVSGLAANATYTGYLYTLDEETGALERGAGFDVQNGEVVHEAEENVGSYAEFHIHVGSTMINLFKATIA